MNSSTRYWAIGILVVVLLIVVVWAWNANKNKVPAPGNDISSSMGESTSSTANTPLERYMEEESAIMNQMMVDMRAVGKTENASVDFLKGMIPHHDSATAMAKSYLKYDAANAELKTLANDIIDTQTKEIDQMNTMIGEIESSGRTDKTKSDAYWTKYDALFTGHNMDHSTGTRPDTVDAAFAEGMIEHHQMAVDMAKAILDTSDEEAVKTLAQDIIDAQEREIALMEAILDAKPQVNTNPSVPSPGDNSVEPSSSHTEH